MLPVCWLTFDNLAGTFAVDPTAYKPRMHLSFWSEIAAQNRARIQSWISDQLEYLLQVTSLTVALLVFRLLRAGFQSDLVDLFEKLDHVTIVIVFGCFLVGTVRRAYVETRTRW
jgi:hypothetical protein